MAERLNNLALFDFDGTITTKDTLIEFIKYVVGDRTYLTGMAKNLPMLLAFKLKLIPNDVAKKRLLYYFFKDISESRLKEMAKKYSLTTIDKITKQSALKKIEWHKDRGDRVVVVSASMECWIKPWCDREEIELISTKLKFKDEKFIGDFDGKNCHGQEKANKIIQSIDLDYYDSIYAYGDSNGDRQMLELATYAGYRVF